MKLREICKDNMSLNECEIEIVRRSIDNIQENQDKELVNDPNIKTMIKILETFLKKQKLVCYGGTAINNLLPKESQFYDFDLEIPDYDFFSPTPVKHAKMLANIYYSAGFDEVEAKAGVHHGTYKVFVNFIPIADITYQPRKLYKKIKKTAYIKDGIYYTHPNMLRMSMYLELSRPKGDVSRWEKVIKRLQLLNKHHPLLPKNIDCKKIKVHKELLPNISSVDLKTKKHDELSKSIEEHKQLFVDIIKLCISEDTVFFGGFANKLYANYTKTQKQTELLEIPDFDILHNKPKEFLANVKKQLQKDYQDKKIVIKKHKNIGEIVATHYELCIDGNTILFVYKPLACHSYNTINVDFKKYGKVKMNIATIDTMLSFYLAFLYSDLEHYDEKRILCMCNVLFTIQKINRLSQKRLLKRFGEKCYGTQETKISIRKEKSDMFQKLKNKKNSAIYEEWFLNYKPVEFPYDIQQKIKSNPKYVMKVKQYNKYKFAQLVKKNETTNDNTQANSTTEIDDENDQQKNKKPSLFDIQNKHKQQKREKQDLKNKTLKRKKEKQTQKKKNTNKTKKVRFRI